jgi:hypothetical protein
MRILGRFACRNITIRADRLSEMRGKKRREERERERERENGMQGKDDHH